MSKEHLKKPANYMYMQGMTYEEISQILPVSPQTLCKWVQDGKWKEQRDILDVSPEDLAKRGLKMLKNKFDVLEKNPGQWSHKDGDGISKVAKAISSLGGVNDLASSAILTMQKFSSFIMSRDHWTDSKKQHCNEGIQDFLEWVGRELF